MTCAEVDESAPGYALDILDAGQRSSVAAHIQDCPRCRETVTRTQASADRLLDIGSGGYAPPEPVRTETFWAPAPSGWLVDGTGVDGGDGPGYDASLGGGLAGDSVLPADWFVDGGDPPSARPGRRRLRAAATMAAVMVLVVSTTLGPEIGQITRPGAHPTLQVPLTAGAVGIGTVRLYSGSPPALEISLSGLPTSGTVRCELMGAGGRIVDLGEFRVVAGKASWAAVEPKSMTQPSSVLIVDSADKVVASADLGG